MNSFMFLLVLISSTLFAQEDGSIISYQKSEVSKTEIVPAGEKGSIGTGIVLSGYTLLLLGVNAEYSILGNANLTAGIGVTLLGEAGYDVGVKYYLRSVGYVWRPRISAYYGTNFILRETFEEYTNGVLVLRDQLDESHAGLTLGIGQQWMWGDTWRHGLDLDILYVITSTIFDRAKWHGFMPGSAEDLQGPIKRIRLSTGYRFGF